MSRVDRDYARVMLLDDATLAYTARLPSGYASLEPNGDNAGVRISKIVYISGVVLSRHCVLFQPSACYSYTVSIMKLSNVPCLDLVDA